MFQPNVEETEIKSNLLLTGRSFVLRRSVKTGKLSTGEMKCKLNEQCNCCSYDYFIAHKSHTGLNSQAGREKQHQAIRSSDPKLKAPNERWLQR